MVRTLVEIQANGRVTVKVSDDAVDGEMSRPEANGTIEALREQISGLRGQVDELEAEGDRLSSSLEDSRSLADFRIGQIRDLLADATERESKVIKAESRAEDLLARVRDLERTEANLIQAESRAKDADNRLAEAEADLQTLANQLAASEKQGRQIAELMGKVGSAVAGPEIRAALEKNWSSRSESETVRLTNVIREVRRIVGTPGE